MSQPIAEASNHLEQRVKIAVIGCGGTISSLVPDKLDVMDYPEFGRKL